MSEHTRNISKRNKQFLKHETIKAYGGKCSGCDEDFPLFLTVDHIAGGGCKHRKSIGDGGGAIYRWLYNQNYPEGFRLLCHNCNLGVAKFGQNLNALKAAVADWRSGVPWLLPEGSGKLACSARERYRMKNLLLDRYGRACVCCGETYYLFLCLDHAAGGGNEHRRQIGTPKGGWNFWVWLKKSGLPDGYRTLCHNCNYGTNHYNNDTSLLKAAIASHRSGTAEVFVRRSGTKQPNVAGQRFGAWVAREIDQNSKGDLKYVCVCDCGTIKSVELRYLIKRQNADVGCIGCRDERMRAKN